MALTPPPPSATATLQLNLLKEYLYFSTLFSPQATLLCATTLILCGNFMGTGIWSVLFTALAPAVRTVPNP